MGRLSCPRLPSFRCGNEFQYTFCMCGNFVFGVRVGFKLFALLMSIAQGSYRRSMHTFRLQHGRLSVSSAGRVGHPSLRSHYNERTTVSEDIYII